MGGCPEGLCRVSRVCCAYVLSVFVVDVWRDPVGMRIGFVESSGVVSCEGCVKGWGHGSLL